MKFKKIYVEITNICNKSCDFCSKTKRPDREMALSDFEHILKEIKEYTNYLYLHIKGEPMLHSKFDEILRLCREYNILVNITTNGDFISKYKEILIQESHVRQINISLQSQTDKKVLLELFDSVNYINEKSSIYLVYRYWALDDFNISISNSTINELIRYYKFSETIQSQIKSEANIKINKNLYINKNYKFEWPNIGKDKNNEGFCLGLKSHIGILSDGTVVPCCLDAEGEINLGNIFKKSFKDIVNSERVHNIKRGFEENKRVELLCQHCNFK